MKFIFPIIFLLVFLTSKQPVLKNTSWKLISIKDNTKQYSFAHKNSILTISDSTCSLNSCVSMWGKYKIDNNNIFQTKELGSYLMNCSDDFGIIQDYYLQHFHDLQFKIENDTLIFINKKGVSFTFFKH